MPCYHPLKAFIVGKTDKGKNKLKITPYEVKYLIKNGNKFIYRYESYCKNALNCGEKYCTYDDECFVPAFDSVNRFVNAADEVIEHDVGVFHRFFTIPCGQCIGCRIDYSKQWATRMLLENEYSSESWFVTLTYNDDFVPRSEFLDERTGELLPSLSLRKKDLVDFNKRLRRHYGAGIRFYGCGEYGDTTFRPHYHVIYFNLHLDDLKFHRRSSDGKFIYYTSDTLTRLWGKGHVLAAQVCFETCAYVARYVTKKYKGNGSSPYDSFNIEPVFPLMSRKPGIGKKWFDDNWSKVYDTYIITVSTSKGGLRFKPPRYYDNLFDGLDGVRMAEIKEKQVVKAQNLMRMKLSKTDLSLLDYLATEELNFKESRNGKQSVCRKEI